MPDTLTTLNQLLDRLSAMTSQSELAAPAESKPPAPDAIDAALATAPRTTAVQSLRHDPVIEAFRNELADGLIRADTAHKLIELLSTALEKLALPLP